MPQNLPFITGKLYYRERPQHVVPQAPVKVWNAAETGPSHPAIDLDFLPE
jgi:hypothetical protein